jgi:hypothetical protein
MEIEDSSLFNEVQEITSGSEKPVFYYWTGEIHTGDTTTELMKVITWHTVRDYENNIGDELTLECAIPLGVYAKIIYPNRAILEITMYRAPISETGNVIREDLAVESERYKAVLVLDGMPNIEGTELGQLTQATLDLKDILTVNFQLFNRSLEKLRTVTVGGIFRNTRTDSVITAILGKESKDLLVDSKAAVDAIDVITGSNLAIRDHIVIPQGTKLIRVPTFIQERCGGVYTTGIGTYFQNRSWYVYPLYDTTKLNQAAHTLTLIKVPKRRFTGIERTYREAGTSIFVLGTSETKFSDDGSTNFMNSGNGVMLADASQFMESIVSTINNKTTISRSKLNSEFLARKKEDGINNVQISNDRISANSFIEYSKLAGRDGGLYEFIWENSKPDLLFPGMLTRILYISNNEIEELSGVLLFVSTVTQLEGVGITGKRHKTTSNLSLFVNKATK